MKLIIQIPCYNEEKTLPITLSSLPRIVDGFTSVEWLIIDDGSSDATSAVAALHGVDYIVRHNENMGLAKAFITGLKVSLENGADVIINTDADNQYYSTDIPALLEPIVTGRSGFVIGIRPIYNICKIPIFIKLLHKIGSVVVMMVSGTNVTDPPSGFRAFSRDVAQKLKVYNNYTYTIETIIQAGKSGIAIETIPISINTEKLRPSRLMTSPYSYVSKSAGIILMSLARYDRPFLLLYLFLPLFIVLFFSFSALFVMNSIFFPLVMMSSVMVFLLLVLFVTMSVSYSRNDSISSFTYVHGNAPEVHN